MNSKVFRRLLPLCLLLALSCPVFAARGTDATPRLRIKAAERAQQFPRTATGQDLLLSRSATPLKAGDELLINSFDFADNDKLIEINAVVRKVGKHCYVVAEKGLNISEPAINKVADKFDSSIYPKTRQFFGNEWKPGIDGDPRIFIFMFDIRDGYANEDDGFLYGYFYHGDCYPQAEVPESNEKEILYMTINPVQPGSKDFMGTLAHEFFHMIHWNHDPEEFTWVDEGLAQVAELVNGFGHTPAIFDFMRHSDNNMLAWAETDSLADYGQTYMFFHYMLGRIARNETARIKAIRALVANASPGIAGINSTLKNLQAGTSFRTLFREFCVANFINDRRIDQGQYAHDKSLAKFIISPFITHKRASIKNSSTIKLWSAKAVDIALDRRTDKEVQIKFQGQLKTAAGHRNAYDVAAILVDNSAKNSPQLRWLRVNNHRADQKISFATDNFDVLKLVIVHRGAENKEIEQSFATNADSARFSYEIRFTSAAQIAQILHDNGSVTAEAMPEHKFMELITAAAKLPQISRDMVDSLAAGDAGTVAAELSLNNTHEKYLELEQTILNAYQNSDTTVRHRLLNMFINFYDAADKHEKRNLHGLKQRLTELSQFDTLHNRHR